jgi:hypothetical protein
MGVLQGPIHVRDRLSCDIFDCPQTTIGDAEMDPDRPIAQDKLIHELIRGINTEYSVAAAAGRWPVHVAANDGEIFVFTAGLLQSAVSPGIATLHLLKNGVDITTAPIPLDSTILPYNKVAGGITPLQYVSGDVFEIQVVITAGGSPPQGLFANVVFREKAG